MNAKDLARLEALVTSNSLPEVIYALAEICGNEADSDEENANTWMKAADGCERLAEKIEEQFED